MSEREQNDLAQGGKAGADLKDMNRVLACLEYTLKTGRMEVDGKSLLRLQTEACAHALRVAIQLASDGRE